jgi:predicted acylesterase/phospholipase RssA
VAPVSSAARPCELRKIGIEEANDAVELLDRTKGGQTVKHVRYAVVLNGGVSLAVWMGGVTHELNRLRLASEGLIKTGSSSEELAPWANVLEAANRTAVVDLIAGSSAGGLNGAVLATAVARGADLPDMRETWKTVASLDVGRLTRRNISNANSLLDGDYFHHKVQDILSNIGVENSGQDPVTVEWRQCTLLITATALDSDPVATELETGAQMWLRDGRRVYKFVRVQGSSENNPYAKPGCRSSTGTECGEQNDFASDSPSIDAIALAARASASFPVAFAPVWETPALIKKRVRPLGDGVGPRWLVDGGVLDNAPFEPLIEALRERAADEPYDRILLYITPAVGKGSGRAAPTPLPPNVSQTLGSVMNATREPDQRLDFDSVSQIFHQMSYSKSQPHNVIAEYLKRDLNPTQFRTAADAVFTYYQISRAEAYQRWIDSIADVGPGAALAPPAPPEIGPKQVPGMPTVCFPVLDATNHRWPWGWSVADRVLRWWARALSELHQPSYDSDAMKSAFNEAMKSVTEAQRTVTEMWCAVEDAATGKPRERQLAVSTERYETEPHPWSHQLYTLMKRTSEATEAAFPGSSANTLLELSISVEVLSGIFNWAGDDYDVPEFRYHNVTPAVETPPGVDIGPIGSQPDWPANKLYGERLNHFGAFISSENGRMHDWLWGRLDGASELSKQLLKPQIQAGKLSEDEAVSLRTELIANILASESQKLKADGCSALDINIKQGAETAYYFDHRKLVRDMADKHILKTLEDTLWKLIEDSTPGNSNLRNRLLLRVGRIALRRGLNKWIKAKANKR